MDFISEFAISTDPQNIFKLFAYIGGGEDKEQCLLMKTNNEGQIKEALNYIYIAKCNSQSNHSDVIMEISNNGVRQMPRFE